MTRTYLSRARRKWVYEKIIIMLAGCLLVSGCGRAGVPVAVTSNTYPVPVSPAVSSTTEKFSEITEPAVTPVFIFQEDMPHPRKLIDRGGTVWTEPTPTLEPTPTPKPERTKLQKLYDGEWVTFKITSYYPYGKWKGFALPNGKMPKQGRTVAADLSILKRETKIEIEGMGVYVVEDCGNAIKGFMLDMFFEELQDALDWVGNNGHNDLKVRIR